MTTDSNTSGAPSCHRGLEKLDQEYDYWISNIDGVIPPDLRGTFVRNGPGRQQIGGNPFGHWFDGDGMLSTFSFLDGNVFFKNRYVRTPKYINETASQRIMYRGFGTMIPSGVKANIGRYPASSISDQVGFDDSLPMRVKVVDLDSFKTVQTFETEPGAIIHFGNVFESGDEIVVDGMHATDFEANKVLSNVFGGGRFSGGRYHRFRLNMKTGDLTRSEVSEHESEFPVFNPRHQGQANNVTYTITSVPNGADSYFNGFQRVTFDGDVQLVTLEPGCYASEPMYAPRVNATGEDDGYILMVVYKAYEHRSELRISRDANIDDQIATLNLHHHLPHQFHGFWSNELLLNEAKYRQPA